MNSSENVKIMLVGGAVRDAIMGLEVKDFDYVVIGATPEMMIERGYDQVGADFPVFLHPETREEYALARIERKTGNGYNGFTVDASPTVTLEEDLQRRDLTMNSMAYDFKTDILHDPFNGKKDIEDKILRHTSEAFAEDPLRIFRIARFAARYNFSIAPETIELCRKLAVSGELNSLRPERIWKEVNRAVFEPYANRFFEVLYEVDAYKHCDFMNIFLSDLDYLLEVFDYFSEKKTETLSVIIAHILNTSDSAIESYKKFQVETDSCWLIDQLIKNLPVISGTDTSIRSKIRFLYNSRSLQKGNEKTKILFEFINSLDEMVMITSRKTVDEFKEIIDIIQGINVSDIIANANNKDILPLKMDRWEEVLQEKYGE